MTARQFVENPVLKLVAAALAIGIAWATLSAQVAQKADKASVEQMAQDIKDIKSILCRDNPDSFCH